MSEQKKTEEQIRHEIRRKFNFSEEREKERIDKAVEMEKDRFKAVQKKQELKKILESDTKKDPVGDNKEPVGTFTIEDSARLQEAKIPVDDWKDIEDWVKYKKMSDPEYSVKNALGDKILLGTLKEKQDERLSSQAINTGKKRGGTPQISGNALLDRAKKTGELPESDEEMDALLEARYSKDKS